MNPDISFSIDSETNTISQIKTPISLDVPITSIVTTTSIVELLWDIQGNWVDVRVTVGEEHLVIELELINDKIFCELKYVWVNIIEQKV